MYRITANFYKDFFIYKDDILILVAERKYIWFAGVRIKVFSTNDELILIYRYFSLFLTKVKIKYQNLPDEIEMVGSIWGNLRLKVNNHRICSRLNSLPKRKMGKIEIDNREVAKITNKKILGSALEFEIEFNEENKFEIYCVLLFLMDISTIESF